MTTWRPRSRRGKPDERLDEPTEGLPAYLAAPIAVWLRERLYDRSGEFYRTGSLQRLQLRFKLDPPLKWSADHIAAEDLVHRVFAEPEFGLDVLDYMLHHVGEFRDPYTHVDEIAAELSEILRLGGSAWEVVSRARDGGFQLTRRAVGPAREVIESIPASSRAHQLLVEAWNKLHGRNPDVTGAYREAVRAVEVAAKPIVLPNDPNATLGKMIAAMRDKPEKWEATLGSVDEMRQLMASVWTSQLDRHGTDDETVPLNVSPEQADAAVHVCLTLARFFLGGHVRRV